VRDKHVWVKWMELRVHGEAEALRGPTGWLPKHDDLQKLFRQVLDKDYSKEDYVKQFTIRVPENLEKLVRIEKFHRAEADGAPEAVFKIIAETRRRLEDLKARKGDYVSPFEL